ncbi:MAG TPA: class I SAM-dependent methyltransferase [Agromyces sp.]|nr:class I SAM-dependent methyltransferase [Agromyces sp.]
MVAIAIPARVRWAVDVLAPVAGERILDIGSGTGASVELIVETVGGGGTVVAIDRSASAVGRIRNRVERAIDDGIVDVIESSVADIDTARGPFDAAIALNVNVFWTTDAAADLVALSRVMAPGARLVIAYGDGPAPGLDRGHLDLVHSNVDASPWFDVQRRVDHEHASALVAITTAHPS